MIELGGFGGDLQLEEGTGRHGDRRGRGVEQAAALGLNGIDARGIDRQTGEGRHSTLGGRGGCPVQLTAGLAAIVTVLLYVGSMLLKASSASTTKPNVPPATIVLGGSLADVTTSLTACPAVTFTTLVIAETRPVLVASIV